MDIFGNKLTSMSHLEDIEFKLEKNSFIFPSFKSSIKDLSFTNLNRDTLADLDKYIFKRENIDEMSIKKTAMNVVPSFENIWNVVTNSSNKKTKPTNLKTNNNQQSISLFENTQNEYMKHIDFNAGANNEIRSVGLKNKSSDKKNTAAKIKTRTKTIITNKSKMKKGCTCTNSRCLRLYCACFAQGNVCGANCQCFSCHNNDESKEIRDKLIEETLQKNPNAFKSKFKKHTSKEEVVNVRGCNCTKTGCIKEYCECFKIGAGCSPLCRCVGCKNSKVELKSEEVNEYFVKTIRKRKKTKFFEEHFGTTKKGQKNGLNK